MATNLTVMEWEMYGAGTALAFRGFRNEEGFAMTVERDQTTVLSAQAPDADTLLRQSSKLREHLHQLGYATRPLGSTFQGGVCWGPAAPLGTSLIDALR